MTDPAQIAKSLSEAQKRALIAAYLVRTNPKQYSLRAYRDGGKLVESIRLVGLTRFGHSGTVLNATGLAVRAILKETP